MSLNAFHIQTFGCKSNQYESQGIREALLKAGFSEAAHIADAGVYIINTCSVTGRAGASCRNAIRKNLRANPHLKVVITGCGVDLGDAYPDLPCGAPLLVPNAKKHALPRLLLRELEVDNAEAARFGLNISKFSGHTRAFIKIQDGCDNFCSYCAVPFARGKPESRPLPEIRDEAKRLVDNGHAELVLTGINIGAYNLGSDRLADVVAALAVTPGLVRLRLGSVEPPQLTRELVRAMAAFPTVCPHVHLPLQSGDDAILSAMGRRYGVGEFMEKVALLREGLLHPAITTDIIVGFPGEDDDAAEAGCAVSEQAKFSRLHVFLFSPRPGTKAASLPRSSTDREIETRKNRLIALGEKLAADYARGCVGLRERVLVEQSGAGLSDRYVRTEIEGGSAAGEVAAGVVTVSSGAGITIHPEV